MVGQNDLKSKILSRIDQIISESETLGATYEEEIQRSPQQLRSQVGSKLSFTPEVRELNIKYENLLRFILTDKQQFARYYSAAQNLTVLNKLSTIAATLRALRSDFEYGLLTDLSKMIVVNIAVDYLQQATELLSEGQSGQFDHIPATVLAGAVLENTLRNLCERNEIEILKGNGDYKTLDPLITELQKANIINKAKANMLRSWAQMRNSAAHGHFDEVDASEVPAMIEGINKFIADYM